jgi:hypothetical protein
MARIAQSTRTGISLAVVLLAVGCRRYSESRLVAEVGLNGGFEVVKDGLPVNWLLYTPKVAGGDFQIVLDTMVRHGGKQSLAFVVRACSSTGGWRSPGFTNEFPAERGRTYTIGFWVMNDSAEFRMLVGGVSATRGSYETVIRSAERIAQWRYVEYAYHMPREFDILRLELNVLRPGTFRIDDLSISGIR